MTFTEEVVRGGGFAMLDVVQGGKDYPRLFSARDRCIYTESRNARISAWFIFSFA